MILAAVLFWSGLLSLIGIQLFLIVFFTNKIGCTEAKQYGYAAAQRSILVASCSVARETRHQRVAVTTVTVEARVGFGGTALEQAAVISVCKGRQGKAENDCECQC